MTVHRADTTLGDLNTIDRDNFSHVDNKECKTYKFPTYPAAVRFMGEAFAQAMSKCGVKIRGKSGERISKTMAQRGVRVEHRAYPPDEDQYRSGVFIYRMSGEEHNAMREIAYFVSNPFRREGLIHDLNEVFYIRTNVKGAL